MRGHTLILASNEAAGNGPAQYWPGGRGYFTAEATWGGGSAKLQVMSLNGTWLDVTSITLSANGGIAFELPPSSIRTVTATATAAYVYAQVM